MKFRDHIAATLIISGIVYYAFNSFSAFIASFISGIFIDIDHILDYYIHTGFNIRIKYFFTWCYTQSWKKLIIFLHSVELVFILWIFISVFKLNVFWIGLAIGFSQHLILDIIFNNKIINIFAYFFLYRLKNGFKKEFIMKQFL